MNRNQRMLNNYIFSVAVIIDEDIYYFTERENILMKISMNSWKLKYSNMFSSYNLYHESRPYALRAFDRRIFKLSLDGKYVEEFSLNSGLYKKIYIGECERLWGNFVAYEVVNHFLYIFFKWKKEIIKINLKNYKKEIVQFSENEKFECFTTACRQDDNIWLFESKNGHVKKYNMLKNRFSYFILPNGIKESICACWKDSLLYLLTSNNYIYIWNPYTNFNKLLWKGEKYNDIEKCFGKIVVIQEKLFLLPCLGKDIVIVDTESGEEEIYKEYPGDFIYYNNGWSKYSDCFEDDNYIYYPMRVSNYIMSINKKSGEITWIQVTIPNQEEKIEFYINKVMIFQDDLDVFMNCLKNNKKENQGTLKIGENIWKIIKK